MGSDVYASNGECGENPQLFRSGDPEKGSPNASPALVELSGAENTG